MIAASAVLGNHVALYVIVMKYTQYDYLADCAPERDRMASWWSDHWAGRSDLKADMMDEPLWATIEDTLRTPGLLLEAGCGTCQWVPFLERQGHRVLGIDYAASGLRIGKAHQAGMRVCQADFRTLPFRANTFDYVVSFGAVEHDVRGPDAALREFARILAPRGWLMCSVPCLNLRRRAALPWLVVRDWLKRREWLRRIAGKTDPFEFYQYVWSPGTYRGILRRNGLEVVHLRPYGRPQGPPVARAMDRLLGDRLPFFSPHMMMAVCRKTPQ